MKTYSNRIELSVTFLAALVSSCSSKTSIDPSNNLPNNSPPVVETSPTPNLSPNAKVETTASSTPAVLYFKVPKLTLTRTLSISPISPEVSGTGITFTSNYNLTPALPPGLTFDSQTGALSGTPTSLSPATLYTLSRQTDQLNLSATIEIEVIDLPPFTLRYFPENQAQNWVIHVQKQTENLIPFVTGGVPTLYSVSPALPNGLLLNQTTGVISGTPMASSPLTAFTLTASNSSGTISTQLNVKVLGSVAPTLARLTSSDALFFTKKQIGSTPRTSVSTLLNSNETPLIAASPLPATFAAVNASDSQYSVAAEVPALQAAQPLGQPAFTERAIEFLFETTGGPDSQLNCSLQAPYTALAACSLAPASSGNNLVQSAQFSLNSTLLNSAFPLTVLATATNGSPLDGLLNQKLSNGVTATRVTLQEQFVPVDLETFTSIQSSTAPITAIDDKLYFSAQSKTGKTKTYEWNTSNQTLVARIGTQSLNQNDSPTDYIRFENSLYFSSANQFSEGKKQLFIFSPATASNQTPILKRLTRTACESDANCPNDDQPTELTKIESSPTGNWLFFVANNTKKASKLFAYHGGNLVQLTDLMGQKKSDRVSQLAVLGTDLYFTADESNTKKGKLFSFSTRTQSITRVAEVNNFGSDQIALMTAHNGSLFFIGTTVSDTTKVFKFTPGTPSKLETIGDGSHLKQLISVSANFPLLAVFDDTFGNQKLFTLSISGNTSAPTYRWIQQTNLAGSLGNDQPRDFTFAQARSLLGDTQNPTVFFIADSAPGVQKVFALTFLSESQSYQLIQVSNLRGNSNSDQPKSLLTYNGRLFFTAKASSTVTKAFVYDPATAQTQMLYDFNGPTHSDEVNFLTVHQGSLVFTAPASSIAGKTSIWTLK